MKRMLSFIFTVMLVSVISVTALAHEVPDLERKGSISADMVYQGNRVSGGSLGLYKVGKVTVENGNYSFSYIKEFEDCSIPITDLSSSGLSKELVEITNEKNISALSVQNIDKNGHVTFSNLDLGLYLVVQKSASPGYNIISPFLVSIPNEENGQYIYDVNAVPKIELKPSEKPEIPKKYPNKLPQTGQWNWPILILIIVGLGFVKKGIHIKRCGSKV